MPSYENIEAPMIPRPVTQIARSKHGKHRVERKCIRKLFHLPSIALGRKDKVVLDVEFSPKPYFRDL